jgi:hypothetical protein
MSRAYRISVKESDTRHLKAGDEIGTTLELLDILPPEDMATLLRQELKERGFEEQADGTLVRTDGATTVTVDPCSGAVTVKAEAEATTTQEVERHGTGFNDVGPNEGTLRDRVRQQAKQDIDKRFDKEQSDLQKEATERLEKKLQELQPEVADVVNKVTRDALKEKARQLGTVTEISEDAESGSLTIKIEV